MSFNTYEDLRAAVNKRREDLLTLEIDLGGEYSAEHEEAKKALATQQGLAQLAGDQPFLNNNIAAAEQRVADTKPESKPVWVKFRRLDLMAWAVLMKKQGLSALDQYESVLKDTFVGVFNDPDATEPLSDDPRLMSTQGDEGILAGGAMNAVVNTFMSWQNSGGEVSIRPTKSGRD